MRDQIVEKRLTRRQMKEESDEASHEIKLEVIVKKKQRMGR